MSDTPITDAAALYYESLGGPLVEAVRADVARKLELERAELLAALRDIVGGGELLFDRVALAVALDKARAAITKLQT